MNVVFDLGGVVVNWQPDALIRSVVSDPGSQALMRSGIIDHPDWVALDRGTLTARQVIDRAVARTGLPDAEIEALFAAVAPSLTLIPETVELMRAAKNAEHGIFVLSNMHPTSIDYLERAYDFWGLVDGAVISCRIGKVKPEPEIYEHLLTEHRLDAAETIFIDDLEVNLAGAMSLGIRGIRFVDAAQCRRDLQALGGLPGVANSA